VSERFTVGYGMADENLLRVALGVAAVAARRYGLHGLVGRRLAECRAIESGRC
jgi:hypothetical protein